jgi:catechol 2,3-dioxygenase-like lactoylglutathione lyase family enzyme
VSVQLGGFHHVAVQVQNVAHVARFYVELLGLPELKRFHRDDGSLRSIWVGASTGATSGPFLAIEQLSGAVKGALGFSMVALTIEAAQRRAIVARLRQLEVPIERETAWTVYVRDPEGNLVGLSHHPHDVPGGGDGATG